MKKTLNTIIESISESVKKKAIHVLNTILTACKYPQIKKYGTEKYFIKYQEKTLKKTLQQAKNTEFGKTYHFKKILQYKDTKTIYKNFSQNIPVVNYEECKNDIEKSKQRDNIIWTKIDKFSVSSGTTSTKKTIPVSKQALKSTRKAGIDSIIMYIKAYPTSKILSAYQRPLWWSIQEVLDNGKILGDISAHIIADRGSFSKSRYLFNIRTLLLNNRQEKRRRKLKEFDEKKTTVMYGVTSRIAEMLETIHQQKPKQHKTFLKNLDGIIRWGVDIKPFETVFKKLNITRKMGVYNASEWFFAIQDIVNYKNKTTAPYLLLPNHWIFYEFIAFNEKNFTPDWELKKNYNTTPWKNIKIWEKYALIITTNAGLRRYLLWDIITFDKNKRCYITWRTKQSLNLKGEELMITHTEKAIKKINEQFDLNINHYMVWPENDNNPKSHKRIIECEEVAKNNSENKKDIISKITQILDEELQKVNNDYLAKRQNDILLQLPIITFVKTWTFNTWLTNKGKLGGQNKIPKLVNKTKTLEEIKKSEQTH